MYKIIFFLLSLCVLPVFANDANLENKLVKIDEITQALIPLTFDPHQYNQADAKDRMQKNLTELKPIFKEAPFNGMLECIDQAQKALDQKNMPQARNKIKTLLSFCIACHNPETRHQMFVANLNSLQFESNFELAEFSYITQDYQTAMGYYDHYITSKGHYKSKEKMQLALERLLSMYTQIEKEPAVAADYVNEYVHYLNEYPELKNLVQQWVVELKKSDPSIAINAGLENYVDNVLSHPADKIPLVVLKGILFNDLNETLPGEKEKPQLLSWLALCSCKLSEQNYQQ